MLKEKIAEVNEIIREKILDGDYKFISCTEYIAKVKVEDEVDVELWIGNNPRRHFGVYKFDLMPYENSSFSFKSNEDRLKGWSFLKPFVEKYRKEKLKKEKLELIEKLQSEVDGYGVEND